MSSRALRKLQADKRLDVDGDVSEEEELYGVGRAQKRKGKKKTPVNPFDLLASGSPSSEGSSEDVKGVEESAPQDEITPCPKQDEEEVKDQNVKQQQSKKKKKKKKGKAKQTLEENIQSVKEDEDIEETIKQVNEMLGIVQTQSEPSSSVDGSSSMTNLTRSLLSVEHRNLSTEYEMRKRFGSTVVRGEKERRRRGQRSYQRQTWLVSPRPNWAGIQKSGLSMNLVETQHGCNYFRVEHSPSYQKIQFDFLDAVESLDPNRISHILNAYPFHIDSLLQLSEICKMGEDYQMAAELVERALYCFECNFHTLFSLTSGTTRLNYKYAENRPLFLALFKHLIYIGQRGCHRTSLEFCKLLLSLSPDEDPLCVLLMMDYYALRADQYSFLIRVYEEWEGHRNLSQLPNFAFSVALAHFHSDKSETGAAKASKLLQDALIMFPTVLSNLTDKCNVQLAKEIQDHSFFGPTAVLGEPVALKQLVSLFVGRNHPLWKIPEVMDWLVTNAHSVLERVDKKEPFVEECAKKRQVRYHGTPRNIYRHLILSDVKDASASLPMELASAPVMMYDPLPPADSEQAYSRPSSSRINPGIDDSNPLSMFFRSLMPSYTAPSSYQPGLEPRPHDPDHENNGGVYEGAQALQGSELARGVESLVTAMRELLSTIRFQQPPQEGGEAGDDHDNEWDEDDYEFDE